jgi:hypothetical protein
MLAGLPNVRVKFPAESALTVQARFLQPKRAAEIECSGKFTDLFTAYTEYYTQYTLSIVFC